MTRGFALALALGAIASESVHAEPALTPVDAAKPGAVVPSRDAWPVAVVDRPLTLARGMASVTLDSFNVWNPATSERSYLGPTAAFALHDRLELDAGLPRTVCWGRGMRGCDGGSALDQSYLGLAFGIRHRDGLALATGLTETLVRASGAAEHSTAIWFIGRRTWFHRLALAGIGQLAIGWDHPSDPASPGVAQTNQTRFYWTEQIEWQVVERFRLFAYGNPYRPIGAPGDESWATRVGGGATFAVGQRWLFAVGCDVDNVGPARSWQYAPNATDCRASATVYRLPW